VIKRIGYPVVFEIDLLLFPEIPCLKQMCNGCCCVFQIGFSSIDPGKKKTQENNNNNVRGKWGLIYLSTNVYEEGPLSHPWMELFKLDHKLWMNSTAFKLGFHGPPLVWQGT
jgi:hypothetical protein